MTPLLNDRQRAYLLALYERDQYAEAVERSSRVRGYRGAPASKWRWIEYGPRGLPEALNYNPPLRVALQNQGLVDQGSGATWTVLACLSLILKRWEPTQVASYRGRILFVQLTRQGRKLARELTGDPPPSKRIETLSCTAFQILAFAYAAHPNPIRVWDVYPDHRKRPPEYVIALSVCKSLAKKGLIEGDDQNCTITDAGRELYERERDHLRDEHPNVWTPPPSLQTKEEK